jgi:hypothetical protein
MMPYVSLHNTYFAFHGHLGVESRVPGMAKRTSIKNFDALFNGAENASARIKMSRGDKGEQT